MIYLKLIEEKRKAKARNQHREPRRGSIIIFIRKCYEQSWFKSYLTESKTLWLGGK